MAFPYCVTQMYIDNTHARTRLEMRGHYKQLFISLPFKSICLRSAAKGTNSNCFPLNTLDRRVRLGSDNDFPRCSPSLLLVLPRPLPPPPPSLLVPPISTRLHLCLRWGFWLALIWLKPDRLHLSSLSLLSLFCPRDRMLSQHSLSFTTRHARMLWPHISGLWGPRTLDTSFSLRENCVHSISMFRLCTLYCYKG